jgi:uncharacterized integral membrane protein
MAPDRHGRQDGTATERSEGGTDARRAAMGPTRTSWTWAFLIVALILGIALVDFLALNTRSTKIEFFWASGHVPLTAALIVGALAGASVVLVVGVMRMIQLRRGLRAGPGRTAGTEQESSHEAGVVPTHGDRRVTP